MVLSEALNSIFDDIDDDDDATEEMLQLEELAEDEDALEELLFNDDNVELNIDDQLDPDFLIPFMDEDENIDLIDLISIGTANEEDLLQAFEDNWEEIMDENYDYYDDLISDMVDNLEIINDLNE